jgi:hypothetical protein
MNIAFWNVNKKLLSSEIADLAIDNDIDVLILAECSEATSAILHELNLKALTGGYYFYEVTTISDKTAKRLPLKFITKIPQSQIRPVQDSPANYYSVKEVALVGTNILICGVHLPSKLHKREYKLAQFAREICPEILNIEKLNNNKNTIVIGDFNMNPFDEGIAEDDAFFAVSSRIIALRQYRRGKENIFYNPTWNLYGDYPAPPGTYYKPGGYRNLFWHSLDQVLLRPPLIENYVEGSLKILTKIGPKNLLTNYGFPNSTKYSDHLPIIFSIKSESEMNAGNLLLNKNKEILQYE